MKGFLIILFLFPTISGFGQSKQVMAQSEYMAAEEAYGNGDYEKTLKHLNLAKTYLGKSNPPIQYLFVKCYHSLEDWSEAETAISKYFEVSDDTDNYYLEMVKLLSDIKSGKSNSEEENRIWAAAKKENSFSSLENYLKKFPKGKHVEEARELLGEIEWEIAKEIGTREAFEKFRKKYPERLPEFGMGASRIEMVLILPGSFQMGGVMHAKPEHKVTITKPYYMGVLPITIEQWNRIMGETKPIQSTCPECLATEMTWFEAEYFIEKLNEFENVSAYRFPTEAEWEYAASTGALKVRTENKIGEWCSDWWSLDYYKISPEFDPQGPKEDKKYRVVRFPEYSIKNRGGMKPEKAKESIGFRVLFEVK